MKKLKIVLSITISVLLLFQNFYVIKASAQSTNFNSITITSRLSGSNRYATSLAISQKGWTHASNVIITTGLNFPDALSASALSKSKDAPIILTAPDSLSQASIDELKRLGTTNAFLIGGTGVISTSVETQLKGLSISITRIAGANRYDTSLKIAEEIGLNNGIVVATGADFPDALSIASIASIKSIPILLSPKARLDDNMEAFIKGKTIPASYIVGGTGVLSSAIDSSVPNSKRLSGTDRFGTNLSINNQFTSDLNFDTVYLATGRDFPDALSGSALAAKNNAPIILTNKDSISTDTLNFMKSKGVKHVVILGGTGVVSQDVESQINAALIVKVTSVCLNKTSDILNIGDTDTLTATVFPSNATNNSVTWSSSNAAVAAVDSNGNVTAKSIGTANITVATLDGNLKANCIVTVNPGNVTSVSLNKTSETLIVGGTETFTATVTPANAKNQNVNWASSDSSIATVDSTGMVTAISKGTAIITVTTLDGGFTATLTLTVKNLEIQSISDINVNIYEWDNYTLPNTVLVNMNNGTQKYCTVIWDTSTVDTSEVGMKTYTGSVDGYNDKVNLYLNIKSFQSDLILTGRSYTLIGSYFYSYGITLNSYITESANIDKIEIYNNGNLNSTYTKTDLVANNIPTCISPNSQWSIGFNFRFGISSTNSYIIIYINNNGHDIPCVYQMTGN